MPDETKPDEITQEQQEIDAELARLKAGQATTTDAVGDTPTPPAAEAKPAEEQPAAEAKPLAPDEVAALRKKLADLEKANGTAFNKLRQRERELEELKAQQNAAPERQASKEPTYEDDPAEYLKQRTQSLEAEITRLKGQTEQQSRIDTMRQQEEAFTRDHPDYPKATQYLIEHETKEWEQSGIAIAQTRAVRNDPNWQPRIKEIGSRQDVQEFADKQGQSPLDVAAYMLARDQYLANRRDLLAAGAEARGRSIAEVAYETARHRGYLGETKKEETGEAARERVLQAKEISDATRSLSESSSAESSASGPRVLRNRQQIVSMSDDELDAMLGDSSQPWKQI